MKTALHLLLLSCIVVTPITRCSPGTGSGTSDGQNDWEEVTSSAPDVPGELDSSALEAWVEFPDYPFLDNNGIQVDEGQLIALASAWCESSDTASGAPEFFFRELPLWTVGQLCGTDALPELQSLLGSMYLSGWYGGIWFRDNAELMPGSSDDGGMPRSGTSDEDFLAIAANAEMLLTLSLEGTLGEVTGHNMESLSGSSASGDLMESMMGNLLTLYGYNQGYVHAVFTRPPAGVDRSGVFLPCPDYLDCPLTGTPLDVYSGFRQALDRLADPPSQGWTDMLSLVEGSRMWADIGDGLWSSGSILPEAWRVLVDINSAYLKVTSAAVLATMLGAVDSNEAAGRCALRLEAAADTWNRAYFLALRSDAPVGTLPVIQCPK